MKLKRDISSTSAPAPDQIEVGELLINANTGILYSKKVDGTIVKWIGSQLCETFTDVASSVPAISFANTDALCCGGYAITVTVNNLLVDTRYRLTVTDLKNNSKVIISEQNIELLPISSSSRSIFLNLNIPTEFPTAILKFSISLVSVVGAIETLTLQSERILSTTCVNC
jgi:hypothetical protein